MKTFALTNGDLALGTGGYQLTTGAAKLEQDLSNALTEPFGNDRFHPLWGSVLNEYIGNAISSTTQMLVQGEVSRTLQNYIKVQQSVMATDAGASRKSRYGPGEVISNVGGVQVRQDYDRYYIKVSLTTLSGENVALVQTVES